MTLALELNYIILDDFAARREASRLGLQVKGTLAIIKKLQQDGQITIDNLEELYQRIISIGFRVKRSIFDDVFS
jgi:predicted nucleic acid-binding protein